MPLTKNPNHNYSIERRWYGDINRRWREATRALVAINVPRLILNFSYTEEQQIEFYLQQIRTIIEDLVLPPEWQNQYQREAYERALKTSDAGILGTFPTEEAAALLFALTTEIDFSQLHRQEVAFLSKRANDALINQMNSFLAALPTLIRDNITLSVVEIKRLIRNKFNSYKSSARRIATTETAQAAQRAALLRSQEIQDATGLKTDVRWVTANDSKVRHLHAGWHGRIFDREQALRNMQISPWNCRCALRPVVETRIPARQNAKFNKERKILLASQKN